jgi:hypothetical protein
MVLFTTKLKLICHDKVAVSGNICILGFIAMSRKGKGKVNPRTGHEGPEGEQRYSSTLSLTPALDGGGWSTPRPGRFTPGNDPVPIVQEAGWAPGPVWT